MVDDADDVQDLVEAVKAEQELVPPDPHAPVARCVPSHVVTFKRGDKDAALSSFNCGANPAAEIGSSFAVPAKYDADSDGPPIASGRVKLDPRPFVKLFNSAN